MKLPINLFGVGIGTVGKSLNVTSAQRTNIYYDIQPAPGDKTQVAAFGTPGCELFAVAASGTIPVSSAYTTSDGGHMFYVQSDKFYELSSIGDSTLRGTLAAVPTGPVEMSDNGTQVVIATGAGLYCYTIASGTFAQALFDATAGAYITANSVTFIDGYFVAAVANAPNGNPDGFYLSSLYDGTAWFSLDFAVPEFMADSLVKVMAKNGVLYLFGSRSTEVWQDIGDATLFPFQRVQGAQTEFGLFAQTSLVSVSGAMVGLMINRQNDLAVMVIAGYEPNNITPPDLAYRIRHMTAPSDCTALSYSANGHDFYQITWNADIQSWLYDLTTGLWSIVKSAASSRHIGALSFPFLHQSKNLVTSYSNGRIYTISDDIYTDNGLTNTRELIGDHMFIGDRSMFRVNSIILDMEQGASNLTVTLQLSRDGGHTFGEAYNDQSSTGEYARFFQFNRLGRGRDIVPKISCATASKFVLIGALANIETFGW